MKKTYQIPTLNLHQLSAECLLFVGTTRPCAHSSITRWTICLVLSKIFGERNNKQVKNEKSKLSINYYEKDSIINRCALLHSCGRGAE